MSGPERALGDRLQLGLVRGLARLPARLQVLLSGEAPVVMDGQRLDPQFQLVRSLRVRRGVVGLTSPEVDLARARRRFTREAVAFAGPTTPVRAVSDLTIPGPGCELAVRLYAPFADDPRPLMLYLHGGGFVFGDLDTHDEPCRILCAYAGMHVLSVAYRLAPEHPFPAALNDTLAALHWARANAVSLGADASRVTIGGDSAGGNLAAVASRLTTRAGEGPVAQLLIYPATDATTDRPSHALFGEGFILTNADRREFTRLYVGSDASRADDRISPLLARDLGGLPPALVVTAGFDVLRDEGEAYAEALRAAGSVARLRRIESMGHGFINLGGVVPAARRATIELAREWRAFVDTITR
ncbi:MAG TPA: alpha/beta hydrolase [Gemmatimonadaceae bacterium]